MRVHMPWAQMGYIESGSPASCRLRIEGKNSFWGKSIGAIASSNDARILRFGSATIGIAHRAFYEIRMLNNQLSEC